GLDVEMCVRQPVGGDGSPFDELRTGLDHLSFGVASRTELEVWQAHLDRHGVTYTPIVDAPYGAGLLFPDSDHIQLELIARPRTRSVRPRPPAPPRPGSRKGPPRAGARWRQARA